MLIESLKSCIIYFQEPLNYAYLSSKSCFHHIQFNFFNASEFQILAMPSKESCSNMPALSTNMHNPLYIQTTQFLQFISSKGPYVLKMSDGIVLGILNENVNENIMVIPTS